MKMSKNLESLLGKYGPELLHELGNILIEMSNDDVKQAINVELVNKYVPPNIIELVENYKARIKELRGNPLTSTGEAIVIESEIVTLKGVIDDLSSWIIYNY